MANLQRLAVLAALAACSSLPSAEKGASQSPRSPRAPRAAEPTVEQSVLHGVTISDPYRWLEDAKSSNTQGWVAQQSQWARGVLNALPDRQALSSRLAALLDRDSVSPPIARGSRLFYERQTKGREKSVLVVREGEGVERVLLDPNRLSDNGSVSLGGWVPSPDGTKLVYSRHLNNADEATLYVLDVETGQNLPQDVIAGAKYAGPSWTPNSQGFYYEWLPTDSEITIADRPGYTEIRYHRLGQEVSRDTRVFPATHDPESFLYAEVTRDGRWLIVAVQTGWSQTDVYVRDARKAPPMVDADTSQTDAQFSTASLRVKAHAQRLGFQALAQGLDATFRVHWWQGHFYLYTNYQAPNYRVIRVAANALAEKLWQTIVPQTEAKLNGVNIVGGKLVLSYLEKASTRLHVHSLEGHWERALPLPGLGSARSLSGQPDADELYFSYSSYTVPSQVHQASVQSGQSQLWARKQALLDTSSMEVNQAWYPSKDGTPISLFLVHRKGLSLDGSHPTVLYGYGGFNVSLTPNFSPLAAVWVEEGGVYAIPNLRGGGEYGEQWHRAGMGANKQNVFDDYIAAAEYLIDRGYTSKQHLGIYGRSNGGLLVGAAMTQRPDLFRAVVCGVPLLDMVRYHLFGSGKTWIPEYGSADNESEFKTLLSYSPYHHVVSGTSYPDLLMLAADNDDRVDPMHARKFVAAVQGATRATAHQALFRLEQNAGHAGGDMVSKTVARYTDVAAFLRQKLTN